MKTDVMMGNTEVIMEMLKNQQIGQAFTDVAAYFEKKIIARESSHQRDSVSADVNAESDRNA